MLHIITVHTTTISQFIQLKYCKCSTKEEGCSTHENQLLKTSPADKVKEWKLMLGTTITSIALVTAKEAK